MFRLKQDQAQKRSTRPKRLTSVNNGGATGIYFFQRICLFTEDLLAVSVFEPTHILT
jgi:hypothetical protein